LDNLYRDPFPLHHYKEKKMIVSPDETYTVADVAKILRKSSRQIQRYLDTGLLKGQRRRGPWQITAIALWKYQGIDQEMLDLWVTYCCRMAQRDA